MTSIRTRAPSASSETVRRVMQANVGRETAAETKLRCALHRAGLRFRKDSQVEQDVRCKADVVFRKARVCVFVDGCFWHGCPAHFKTPRTNAAWWWEKIADNRKRDARQSRLLRTRGWHVMRFWEHQVCSDDIRRIVRSVQSVVRSRS